MNLIVTILTIICIILNQTEIILFLMDSHTWKINTISRYLLFYGQTVFSMDALTPKKIMIMVMVRLTKFVVLIMIILQLGMCNVLFSRIPCREIKRDDFVT